MAYCYKAHLEIGQLSTTVLDNQYFFSDCENICPSVALHVEKGYIGSENNMMTKTNKHTKKADSRTFRNSLSFYVFLNHI